MLVSVSPVPSRRPFPGSRNVVCAYGGETCLLLTTKRQGPREEDLNVETLTHASLRSSLQRVRKRSFALFPFHHLFVLFLPPMCPLPACVWVTTFSESCGMRLMKNAFYDLAPQIPVSWSAILSSVWVCWCVACLPPRSSSQSGLGSPAMTISWMPWACTLGVTFVLLLLLLQLPATPLERR